MARRSGRPTDYTWANIGDVNEDVDIGGAARPVVGFEFAEVQTVTRIRGRIGATLDAGAVHELGLLLLGITIVSMDAFTGGIVPEIFTLGVDEGSWIWQGSIFLSSGSEAAIQPDALSGSVDIDTKAMRRVKATETLVIVAEAPAALWIDQTGVIDVSAFAHILLGL